MDLHVDLGQTIIAGLVAIVGYFIKKEISGFGKRLDRHEETIFTMAQDISRAIGELGILNRIVGVTNMIEMNKVMRSGDKQS